MKTNIIKVLLGLILTFSISGLYAQSPRIKLNQIVKDTVSGSVLISNLADSNMVYSRNFYIGSDTSLVFFGTTIVAGGGGGGSFVTLPQLTDSLALYATKVELSDSMATVLKQVATDLTLTGDGTGASPLKVDTSVIATVSALRDSLAGIISSVSTDVTLTGDGSVGNPLKVDTTTYIATKGDLNGKQDQLNGTGFVKASGTIISYDNSTYLTTEVDGSVTNELQTISYNSGTNTLSLSDGGGTADLSNLALVDSTRINATGDTALYYQNGVLIGTGAIAGGGGGSGTVTSVDVSGGTTGLTTSGGPVTTSGTITIAGTLDVDNGGTGATSFTSGQMLKGNGTSAIQAASNLREDTDTVYVDKFLNVDDGTLYVNPTDNRVGIGTTSPSEIFEINSNINGAAVMKFVNTNSVGNAATSRIQAVSDSNAIAQVATYNTGFGFDVFGTNGANRAVFVGFNGSSNPNLVDVNFGSLSNVPVLFGTNNTERMRIKANGDLKLFPETSGASSGNAISWNSSDSTIYFSTSSIRFKENIQDYDKGIEDIMKLKPVYFNYKTSPQLEAGFIAEDVDNSGFSEYITRDGSGLIYGLRVGAFKPLIVKAIQEQQEIIESQANKIATLEEQIELILNEIEQLKNK